MTRPDTKRKRSRLGENDLLEADARLAQTLQQEEYGEQASSAASGPRQRRVLAALDTEDEDEDDDVLSDLSDFEMSDVPLSRRKRPRISNKKASGKRASKGSKDSKPRKRNALNSEVIMDSEDDLPTTDSDDSLFALARAEMQSLDESEASEAEEETEDDDAQSSLQPDTTTAARRSSTTRRRWRRRDRHGVPFEDRAIKERRRLEKAHPEIKTMWDELKNVEIIVPKAAEQPAGITRKLKSFQLEGLDWMMRQEKSQWKGGLLGDEMGMGKTIQAVSLIMSDYPAGTPSLVVVPPVALMQWQNEINEYTNGKLKVLVYHNTNPKVKNLGMGELKKFDVILISYSGLESIYRKESKGWKRDDGLVKENSKIHAIHYHRLILDEAHNIKSRTTSCAKACFALKADHNWCLSGTPVQNRIGEFFSLLRFLRIEPFACYFCKKCPCSQLHWNQNEEKRCTNCNHTGFEHVSIFNQELLNPITQGEDRSLRQEGLRKLRLVTDRIMLRRMKRDHTSSMELPPKEVIIHNEFFGEIERDFSSSIMSNTTRQFDTYVSRGVMLNNYANIFGLIMQMRQVANVS